MRSPSPASRFAGSHPGRRSAIPALRLLAWRTGTLVLAVGALVVTLSCRGKGPTEVNCRESVSIPGYPVDSFPTLRCVEALLITSAAPVVLPNLTRISSALAVRAPATSVNMPVLSRVDDGLSIDSEQLTDLRMPVLARVDNGFAITGTKITTLAHVGCPRVTNGVVISFNTELPQAAAQAKAQCMTVQSGSVTVEGNKP